MVLKIQDGTLWRGDTPTALPKALVYEDGKIKVCRYGDGSVYYTDLGVLALPGEDLTMALARLRAEKIQVLFGEAQIPERFKGWEFTTFPGDKEALAMARKYVNKQSGESLFILGDFGVGKTSLAISILRERIAQDVPSLFVSVPDLLDKIRSTFDGHGDYTEVMEAIKKIDFLVLDDLGAEYPTMWAKEKLYQLIGYRHAWELPMVGTSNLTLGELERQLGSRSLWRMLEMGKVLVVEGKDLRRRKG